jgi:hypothetical protein
MADAIYGLGADNPERSYQETMLPKNRRNDRDKQKPVIKRNA